MGRASLLSLCLNSLHKADAWAYALGLHSGPVPILFSTSSIVIINNYLINNNNNNNNNNSNNNN